MDKTDEAIYSPGTHIIAEWGEVYEVLEDKGRASIQVKLAYTPSTHGEVLRRQLKPYKCACCGATSPLLAVTGKEYRCINTYACNERKEQDTERKRQDVQTRLSAVRSVLLAVRSKKTP